MRTTIRLNENLLERAKARAAAEGRTLTSLIEEGLTVILATPKGVRPQVLENCRVLCSSPGAEFCRE